MTSGTKVEDYIKSTLYKLEKSGYLEDATVVLLGSVARGTSYWRSDTDILIVSSNSPTRWRVAVDLHLQFETRNNFLKRLRDGDDFPAWALRYGKVLWDASGWWKEVQADPASRSWPDWKRKVDQARRRLSIAAQLLDDGDLDAAEEEYLFAAAQIARGFLLKARVFPLSRPEIPRQLSETGLNELAKAVRALLKGTKTLDELRVVSKVIDHELELIGGLVDSIPG